MRPLKLEVAGFTTFREPTEVDFDGVDYFALVGPTGSGKSSIIDAICFALYGKVPRLDLRSVEPVISQGKQEARIRLDFAIGDTAYTAVRVVRRIASGASTKEARLERGADLLAGDADGVSAEVERLLGLGFQQFTRCVVLPQGEFARFMHDRPADRQELLVKLLDLAIYGRMAQLANQRASKAETELAMHRRRLDEELASATRDALDEARAALQTLESLHERIESEEPAIEELRETRRTELEKAAAARAATQPLGGIAVPDGISELGEALSNARASLKTAEQDAERAEDAVKDADAAVAALPEKATLQAALHAHDQMAAIRSERDAARAEVERVRAAAQAASAAAADAETAAHGAQIALEAARVQHRALDLARSLEPGQPCPVCRQEVHDVPSIEVPADLDEAQRAADAATTAHKAAERARADAEQTVAAANARAEALAEQITGLEGRVREHPDAAAAREVVARIDVAERGLTAARSEAGRARDHATKIRRLVASAEDALGSARQDLARARDGVSHLSPPPLTHDDLAADWRTLAEWSAAELDRQRAAAADADARAGAAEERGLAMRAAQRQACTAAGIPEGSSPRDDCLKAIERQRAKVERIEVMLEEAERIREEVATLDETHVVAKELGKHLKANAFERWVLKQALTSLTDGATQILHQLSGGQYSLTLDKSFGFAVIDHRNANATRSAKTLSGGETFLASLALALAMADRIAQLSANTAVRLESIFLDEGFGTLDPETLETVATAIESLGASNRVVGIVTHVRDLAERIPVRFEVRKGPTTSVVEKVLA